MTDIETSSSPRSRNAGCPRASADRRGFTLIEVMVALAVVAFAFVGLVGLHGRNIQLVDRANHFSRATLLAREMLTQLQFDAVGGLSDGSGTFEAYPEYHWTRQVTDSSFDTVKLVRLTVFWDGGTPIELVYYVGQPDE
jgi:type II secretion system protein I